MTTKRVRGTIFLGRLLFSGQSGKRLDGNHLRLSRHDPATTARDIFS
jgi:hypothetical protein